MNANKIIALIKLITIWYPQFVCLENEHMFFQNIFGTYIHKVTQHINVSRMRSQ